MINLSEKFPHLKKAPAIEAIIDIRAHSTQMFDEGPLREELEKVLVGYEFKNAHREFAHEVKLPAPKEKPEATLKDLGFKGVRYGSADEKRVAQFNRDGFVFSWLAPYPDWDTFVEEAFSLWSYYKKIAKPEVISRIGLRYINKIKLAGDKIDLNDYTVPPIDTPRGLDIPMSNFLHQNTLTVPDTSYSINLIRTIQVKNETPPIPELIIDIDVFTMRGEAVNDKATRTALTEMRWLKNKAFFGSITEKALGELT